MLKAKQYCYIPWTSLWLTFSNFFYKCLSMLFQTLFPNYEDKVVKKVDLTNWQCQRTEEARREVLATSRGERQARPSPTLAPPFVLHCSYISKCCQNQTRIQFGNPNWMLVWTSKLDSSLESLITLTSNPHWNSVWMSKLDSSLDGLLNSVWASKLDSSLDVQTGF